MYVPWRIHKTAFLAVVIMLSVGTYALAEHHHDLFLLKMIMYLCPPRQKHNVMFSEMNKNDVRMHVVLWNGRTHAQA